MMPKSPSPISLARAGARILRDLDEWKNPEKPPSKEFRDAMVRGLRTDITQHVRTTFSPSLGKVEDYVPYDRDIPLLTLQNLYSKYTGGDWYGPKWDPDLLKDLEYQIQSREDAAKQQATAKVEREEERRNREEMAQEEQIKNVSKPSQPTFGRNPFEKTDEPQKPAQPSSSRLGLSNSAHQHGAEGFVPAESAKAAIGRRAASPANPKVSTGGSHGSQGRGGSRTVTSRSGAPVMSAGGAVTTGNRGGKTKVDQSRAIKLGLAYEGLGGKVGAFGGGASDNGVDSRVVCTELAAQGLLDPGLYFLDVRFTEERLSAAHVRGYHAWAVPLVRLMRKSEIVTRIVSPVARWRAEEIAHLLGAKSRGHLAGKIVRLIGEPLCRLIGAFVSETDHTQLYETETVQ
ncbi:MAG: hypothetical protein HN403_19110 [Rhodospirillales bacterium]|nr:hypothetical protein [Rhodospirillales bacterium]